MWMRWHGAENWPPNPWKPQVERDSRDEQRRRAPRATHGGAWVPGESGSFGAGKTWDGFEGRVDFCCLKLIPLLITQVYWCTPYNIYLSLYFKLLVGRPMQNLNKILLQNNSFFEKRTVGLFHFEVFELLTACSMVFQAETDFWCNWHIFHLFKNNLDVSVTFYMAPVMDPEYDLVFLSWFHLVPLEALANSAFLMFNSKKCKCIKIIREINTSLN